MLSSTRRSGRRSSAERHDMDAFIGSIWFGMLMLAVGFGGGWYVCKKHGHKL